MHNSNFGKFQVSARTVQKMYHREAQKHLRRAVKIIDRSCFGMLNCFEWDAKTKRVIPLRTGPKWRNFRILCNIFIFLLGPVFVTRSFLITRSSPSNQGSLVAIVVTFAATLFVVALIPIAWNLRQLSGTKKYIYVFETTMRLERYFEGTYVCKLFGSMLDNVCITT